MKIMKLILWNFSSTTIGLTESIVEFTKITLETMNREGRAVAENNDENELKNFNFFYSVTPCRLWTLYLY